MKAELVRNDLVLPEMSYKIVGCAYEVFKELGPGLLEKVYQKGMAKALTKAELRFEQQIRYELMCDGEKMATSYFDFLVEDKVVVELKRGKFFFNAEIEQVLHYLKTSDKKLGLIIRFTDEGARFKRVVNIR